MDLHYGRDDFAGQDRLVRTLSRDRAKDMASDYERADPARSYAERRGITFRERVAEIVRKVVPEKVRGMFGGLHLRADGARGPDAGEDPEAVLRKARTEALKRHARAVAAIFSAEDMGGNPQEQPAGGSAAMPEPDRIIRLNTVRARTGLSKSTIYRKITEGTPTPDQDQHQRHGLARADINRWVANPAGWRAVNDNEDPGGKAAKHDAG